MDQERRPGAGLSVRRDPLGPTIAGSSHHPDDQYSNSARHTRAAILRALDISRTDQRLSRHVGYRLLLRASTRRFLRNAGWSHPPAGQLGAKQPYATRNVPMHRQRSSDNRADRVDLSHRVAECGVEVIHSFVDVGQRDRSVAHHYTGMPRSRSSKLASVKRRRPLSPARRTAIPTGHLVASQPPSPQLSKRDLLRVTFERCAANTGSPPGGSRGCCQ